MIIAPALLSVSDLEDFNVRAVANGWVVTLRADSYRSGGERGEQFVFATPEELAAFLVKVLPRHEGQQ